MRHWIIEAYMPFRTKEREAVVWDFKRKAGNSQVDEKEQTCNKQILVGSPEILGHGGASNQQTCLGAPCLLHLVLILTLRDRPFLLSRPLDLNT